MAEPDRLRLGEANGHREAINDMGRGREPFLEPAADGPLGAPRYTAELSDALGPAGCQEGFNFVYQLAHGPFLPNLAENVNGKLPNLALLGEGWRDRIKKLGNVNEILSQNIRALRELRGWTQDHASELAGVPKRTYSRAENPHETKNIETLEAIAHGFRVPISELFRPPGDDPSRFVSPEKALETLSKLARDVFELQAQLKARGELSGVKRELIDAICSPAFDEAQARALLTTVRAFLAGRLSDHDEDTG